MGRVFRLNTTTGAYAVKELFWGVTDAEPDDIEFQRAVLDAGVRIPRPVLTPDGDVVVDGVRVYEWIDLVPIEERPASIADIGDVAGALARIHGLGWSPGGEPDPWYTAPVGAERWDAVVKVAVDAGAAWGSQLVDLLPELHELDAVVAAAPALALARCHLDFNRSNVARTLGGQLVVLDWENSGSGAPAREAAGALLEWTMNAHGVPDHNAVAAFFAGYGDIAVDDLTIFAATVAATNNFLAQCCELAPSADTLDDHRAFWDDAASGMLAQPLTIDTLDRMLAAARAARP
jgi:Ser/Thr protein kinase RdoA (MazF antagonist)